MIEAHYELLPEEYEYLKANYSSWDHLSLINDMRGLAIHKFPIPSGYVSENSENSEYSDMMIIIPQGYPAAGLDMFYFSPGLKRTDGNEIVCLSNLIDSDRTWQAWSRHYPSASPWVPGEDNIIRHIEFVKNVLEREVKQ